MNEGAGRESAVAIGERVIGRGHPCLILAEVAQAHEGSLGIAHSFVDAAADAGACAVKFQTHIAEAESSPLEPFRVAFGAQDRSRYDYWKRMEFSAGQWRSLAEHARDRGLIFLSSPFSEEAAGLLEELGVPAWKVASGEVTHRPLLERLAATGRPLLVSTGMSGWSEIDELAGWLGRRPGGFALLQCTTAYPCPAEKVGLNVMGEMRERYGCPVGLSDHTGAPWAGLAAAALGADLLEVHVTFSRRLFGPDAPASLTFEELTRLVEGVRFIERMHSHPADKDAQAEEARPLREIFTRSLFAASDLPAGTALAREHLVLRKPGTGIGAGELDGLLGRRLARGLARGEMLTRRHLGEQ